MKKNHNEKTCFNHTNERYIGSWFGHDVYEYDQFGGKNLLATFGNEPGDYCTWIGDKSWFLPDASIYYMSEKKSVPMSEHLFVDSSNKAFLMAMAFIYNETK